jgi:hypothetical protein
LVKAILAFILFFTILIKVNFFSFDIFDFKNAKSYFNKRIFEKVFIIPSQNSVEIFSFDRKLFMSRMLDYINIANREFLFRSGEWKELTLTSLALNQRSLNTLIITAYQYMSGRTSNDFSNFLFIDK